MSEQVSTSTTSSVPRTTSRNAYTQQRLSILRKQQQKEQASRSAKEQEKQDNKHLLMGNHTASSSVKVHKAEDMQNVVEDKEGKGVRNEDSAKLISNLKLEQ